MDRRAFLDCTAVAAACAALPGCAALVATPVTPVRGEVRLALRNFAALSRPGGYLRIRPTGSATALYVLALDDGAFAVVSPVCTHLGCTVGIEGAQLLCPCHGSMYDREGRVLRGPAMRALERFPAVVTPEGDLVIRLAVTS